MALTSTQQQMLTLIAEHIRDEGVPPSQAEIARSFGFKGVRAAQYHLEALEAAGAIERVPGRARGIRVCHPVPGGQQVLALSGTAADDPDAVRLPVLGRVAAGEPIGTAIEHDRHLLLDRSLFAPFPDYLLEVHGESMRDEGILEGDLIGVHQTAQADPGQIVIARIDGEITVKRLAIEAGQVRLLPRNGEFAPIVVEPGQEFAIEGLYCGLVRPHRITQRPAHRVRRR
ncbi:MAG: transcriptional repressor LexA [Xanthomonadales bacterium]|nr:transcriptional repressor LexA [Xanthomonadales bacterium]